MTQDDRLGSAADRLDQIARTLQRVGMPGVSTAADASGSVTCTVNESGVPQRIEIAPHWRNNISARIHRIGFGLGARNDLAGAPDLGR
jgi:hypothetical protein